MNPSVLQRALDQHNRKRLMTDSKALPEPENGRNPLLRQYGDLLRLYNTINQLIDNDNYQQAESAFQDYKNGRTSLYRGMKRACKSDIAYAFLEKRFPSLGEKQAGLEGRLQYTK